MTAIQLYEAALIEINKLEAPSMLLEDYNYFINKAVQQYINIKYNLYDINQQLTDDLRVLKKTVILDNLELKEDLIPIEPVYLCNLPEDYLHMLNCIVIYSKSQEDSINKCQSVSDEDGIYYAARRLTADLYPSIIDNAYLKPAYNHPYYYINSIGTTEMSNVAERLENVVYCNSERSIVHQNNLEIRCGKSKKYTPEKIYIDYLKVPDKIELTYEQINGLEDSQTIEFPDYVCYEIINEFVKLLLENASDPRLQTNYPINQTILAGETNVKQ